MKTFLEVFPDLHIAENVRGLLEMVGIEKISTNRDRSVIRVYIDSPRLMHKQSIYDLEKGIKEQLFPGKRVTIKILEKYHLSSQYTPEKLMNVYRDSILMELKNYSILLYNMFRKAEMDFEEEGYLKLSLEDTMIVRDKAPELVRILEKIFTERCNVPMVVKTSYRPVEKKNTEPEIDLHEAAGVRRGVARQAEAARLPEQQVPMRRIWNRRGQNLPLAVSICHLTRERPF